jgi:signal transduction histidine kinase
VLPFHRQRRQTVVDAPARRSRIPLPGRRVSWPLVLLFASIGVTAIAAFNAQRAVYSHQRTASRLLRDYASFTAWTSQRQVSAGLEGAVMASLQYIMHGRELHQRQRNGAPPNADDLWRYYNNNERFSTRLCTPKRCPESFPPSVYFGFKLGSDTLRVAPRAAVPEADAWLEVAPASDRRWLVDSLTTHARTLHDPEQNYEVLVSPRFGTGRMIAYALMPTDWGDTIVYGVEFGAETSRHIFRDAFANEPLLPKAVMLGKSNEDLLGVRVVGPGSLPLFESPRWPATPYVSTLLFPPNFGGLAVQAAIRSEYASQLVIGGLPRSRLPLLLGMLGMSSALAIVAVVQLRREEELARLRSDFVSSVSHELRTPLAQIRLFLETLRLGRFTTDAQRQWSLDNIDRETNRLAHLVENILYFARAGRAPASRPRPEPTDLGVELAQIARAFEPLAASRRASLRLDLAPNVVVPLPREAFRQVLLNLLDNAVKYGPAGQTITVSLAAHGSSARVTVADEGPGVPAREREAIWTPFFRGDAAAAQGAGGSGIGLAIVKDLVAQMGARIEVGTASGRGAAFHLDVPVAQRASAATTTVDASFALRPS